METNKESIQRKNHFEDQIPYKIYIEVTITIFCLQNLCTTKLFIVTSINIPLAFSPRSASSPRTSEILLHKFLHEQTSSATLNLGNQQQPINEELTLWFKEINGSSTRKNS